MAINSTDPPGGSSSRSEAVIEASGIVKSIVTRAIDANKKLSRRIDAALVRGARSVLREFVSEIEESDFVADVGGGKKPAKLLLGLDGPIGCRYDGFDLDLNELVQAGSLYSSVHALDVTKVDEQFHGQYHKVICKSTLEHVLDAEKAMSGLSSMLRDGGRLYISVPHRYAAFAVLNRLLPNETKRRMLHYIFPNKAGDGFPAYYLCCTIADMERNAAAEGLSLVSGSVNKHYSSTYFMFFVPIFLLWRAVTAMQYLLYEGYCERFEMIFEKKPFRPSEELGASAT